MNLLPGLKVDRCISYRTLARGIGIALPAGMPEIPHTVIPITNLPAKPAEDGGMLEKHDMTIYRLKREVAVLRDREAMHLQKLAKCASLLTDLKMFFDNGLNFQQWESYDAVKRRRLVIEGTLALIHDPSVGPDGELKKLFNKKGI